jgi:hypothetical protein
MIWRPALSLFLCSGIIILGIYINIGRSRQDTDIQRCGPITLENYVISVDPRFASRNRAVVRLVQFTEQIEQEAGFWQEKGGAKEEPAGTDSRYRSLLLIPCCLIP